MLLSKDIIQLIHEDHNRVRVLYRQYKTDGNTPRQKQQLALDIIRHSTMHSRKEDMVLGVEMPYTAVSDGTIMLSQHHDVEEQMEQLLAVPFSHPSFDTLLDNLMRDMELHLQTEERELLPHLQQSRTQDQLMQLGQAFEWAKLIAPSRPHAWTPKAPPVGYIVNALLCPFDFVKDMLAFEGAPTL